MPPRRTVSITQPSSSLRPDFRLSSISALVMGAFAAIWWLIGVRSAGLPWPVPYLVPGFFSLAIPVAAIRTWGANDSTLTSHGQNPGRVIGIASGMEGAAILVAVIVLANTGRQDYAAPVIAMIVGLHFVPIARGLRAKVYHLPVGLLVAIGAIGIAVPDVRTRLLVVCLGAASALWLTSAAVLRSSVATS